MEKKLPDLIAQIRAAHPDVPHWDLWTMDEHRIGLKLIVRRIWARSGERPIIAVQQRYQWRYVHGGGVQPGAGGTSAVSRPGTGQAPDPGAGSSRVAYQ